MIIEIRPATAADAAAIADLHQRSWRNAYRGLLPDAYLDGPAAGRLAAHWGTAFAKDEPRRVILVAAAPDGLVGFVAAWPKEVDRALIAAGRMAPAGLAAVEAARRDGRWDKAYGLSRHRGVPDDLQAALDNNPVAAAFFATLDSRNRYAVLYRVQTARTPETRARRVADFIAMLARGERIHPSRIGRAHPAA